MEETDGFLESGRAVDLGDVAEEEDKTTGAQDSTDSPKPCELKRDPWAPRRFKKTTPEIQH